MLSNILSSILLLAKSKAVAHDVSIKVNSGTNSLSWALIIFCVVLGLLVTLNPARRTSEIKRTKE